MLFGSSSVPAPAASSASPAPQAPAHAAAASPAAFPRTARFGHAAPQAPSATPDQTVVQPVSAASPRAAGVRSPVAGIAAGSSAGGVQSPRPAAPSPAYGAAGSGASASPYSSASRTRGRVATRRVPAGTAAGGVPPTTPAGRRGRAVKGTGGPYDTGQPPRRRRNVLSFVLIAIGIVLLLVAGGLFVRAQLGYQEAKNYYDKIEQQTVSDTSGDGIPTVDFASLKALSKDAVGWVYIPGTVVNYPVAHGNSNTQYLRHFLDGSYNENGTIFMDVDGTAPGVVDQQTTLYGHHMNDGSMFKVIDDTLKQDEFNKIEHVYYITPDATYVFKPMFTAQVQDDYTDARRTNFDSDAAFTQYLQAMLAQAKASASDAGEQVTNAKQVLTLVTCAGDIIPRTTRAAMVCTLEETIPATTSTTEQGE